MPPSAFGLHRPTISFSLAELPLITLPDACVIAGFLPSGRPVRDISYPKRLRFVDDRALSYGNFLHKFRLNYSPISDAKHVAFLQFWLSKYVFFHPALEGSRYLLGIASSLSEGTSIALGPLILAAFYRGLTHASLATQPKGSGTFLWFILAPSNLDCFISPVACFERCFPI